MSNYCVLCGAELILHDNQMKSDVEGWDENRTTDSEDAMITYAKCPHCLTYYEMMEASKNEQVVDPTYLGSISLFKDDDEEE